ncbi:MAG: NAD(P)/FAD-dependent oxidoreductase [Deltaproteobacteria bacterium]
MNVKKIIVVGAGPAGMMAAIRAAQKAQQVTLIEKNSSPGKKLLLSGKGRCNLTNTSDLNFFIERFSENGQFLRDAFKKFFHPQLMRFFQERGLELEVERQQRVFPAGGKSQAVLEVLKQELNRLKVNVMYNSELKDIAIEDGRIKGISLRDGRYLTADRLILATGGVSYSFTGSTGDDIRLAEKLGHRIVALRPALVPLETKQKDPAALMGLTLKNIRLKFSDGKKEIDSGVGELLFTDFGISGPLVLSLSGRIAEWISSGGNVFVTIDLKPALTAEQLDRRLLREFKLSPKKNLKNTLKGLLPLRLIEVFIGILKISPDKKTSHLSQKERRQIIGLLKGLRLDIVACRPIEEAMVTRGGVSAKDINPRTMESRVVAGLYFAGEMVDISADTGGFNLQAAFSTGYLAGESAGLN